MIRKKNSTWFILLTMVVSVALISLIGCESKSVLDETETPAGTEVSVTASPTLVEIGEMSVVEATVVANSSGVANQVVTFTVSPTNAGYFTPAIDTTNANGVAASVFTASTTGNATISGTLDDNTTNSVALTISDVPVVGSGNVSMSLSETLLLANGADTSQVTINVRDASNQPAPESTLVTIVAGEKFVDLDGDGSWSAGDSLIDANANGIWDAVGIIMPSPAYTTGATGAVTVDYISGYEATTVYVKATVNDKGISGNFERLIQLTPNATIGSIFLASDSMNLTVKETGGIETSMLHATGYDEFGNTVPAGLTIEFIITDGPSDPSDVNGEHLGSLPVDSLRGPFVAITNSQGVASCPISSGFVSGTIRIRAYANTALSNATQIMVSAGPPAYIVVGAEDCNVPYWFTVAEENAITAVVSDIYLNPVTNSTAVYFSTDEGTMKSHEARTDDLEGIVSTIWFSGNNVATADGIVWVKAETSGGNVVCSTYFFNSSYTASITTSGLPTTMQADGTDVTTVVVSGFDVNGNPVDDGVSFEGGSRYIASSGGTFENGCYSPSGRVEIKSTTLDMDRSTPGGNDDGIGAIDSLKFWSGIAYVSYPIILTTGHAYSGNCSIEAISKASAGEVVNVSALIADRWGNPLGDHTLNMSASGGVVAGASQETNAYGEANGFTWTAPAGLGDYTITVADTDPRGSGITIDVKITVE